MSSAVDFIDAGVFGPLFIGVVVAGMLLGISMLQAYYYYRDHNDSWKLKHTVTATLILGIGHQALYMYTVYYYVFHPEDHTKLLIQLSTLTAISAVISILVQSFLVIRIWRLSDRNIWLTFGVTSVLVAEYAAVIAAITIVYIGRNLAALARVRSITKAISLLGGVGDLIIALVLCVLLHRSRTGFQRSDTIINKLIVYSVNTGLITSFCAIAAFVAFVASPDTDVYITFHMCISRLYTCTFLASLNARRHILREASDINYNTAGQVTFPLSEISRKETSSRQQGRSNLSIKITTTKNFVVDDDVDIHDEGVKGPY